MKPPTGGPTTGPNTAGTVRYDIAVTSSDLAMFFRTIRRRTGTIMAPPNPCRMRDATNSGSEFEKPQNTEPVVKIRIAVRKTVRAPNRSAIQPLIGMKTARLSKYDVIARFSLIGSSPSDLAIAGRAVEMTVASSISMKSAQPTIIGARNSSAEILEEPGLIETDNSWIKPTIWKSIKPVNARLNVARDPSQLPLRAGAVRAAAAWAFWVLMTVLNNSRRRGSICESRVVPSRRRHARSGITALAMLRWPPALPISANRVFTASPALLP